MCLKRKELKCANSILENAIASLAKVYKMRMSEVYSPLVFSPNDAPAKVYSSLRWPLTRTGKELAKGTFWSCCFGTEMNIYSFPFLHTSSSLLSPCHWATELLSPYQKH